MQMQLPDLEEITKKNPFACLLLKTKEDGKPMYSRVRKILYFACQIALYKKTKANGRRPQIPACLR